MSPERLFPRFDPLAAGLAARAGAAALVCLVLWIAVWWALA
ncbi:MAG TPA: hypothetical protein VKS60_13490 [Stellaceae bacterium]|nr:hypothetical protein [Stellaceae bacterium]